GVREAWGSGSGVVLGGGWGWAGAEKARKARKEISAVRMGGHSPWGDFQFGVRRRPPHSKLKSSHLLLTEKVRSIRVALPCRSLTETVKPPFGSSVMGVASFSSQTPCDVGRNFGARLVPAGTPSTGKSAVTVKLSASKPL